MAVITGGWYNSKRGALIRVDEVHPDGSALVTVQMTGRKLEIDAVQVSFFTPAEAPASQPGTSVKEAKGQDDSYKRYPHIVPDSIYRVQNNTKDNTPKWMGKKRATYGATRCLIKCACGNTRDIKLQDAFQVKLCEPCQKQAKRQRLKKFLEAKHKVDSNDEEQ